MKIKFNNHFGELNNIFEIGAHYASNRDYDLQVGDIVMMPDDKEGIVVDGRIMTRKEVGGIHHVKKIIKKHTELNVGEVYLKGLVEIIE